MLAWTAATPGAPAVAAVGPAAVAAAWHAYPHSRQPREVSRLATRYTFAPAASSQASLAAGRTVRAAWSSGEPLASIASDTAPGSPPWPSVTRSAAWTARSANTALSGTAAGAAAASGRIWTAAEAAAQSVPSAA